VDLTFGIGYSDDISKAEKVLAEILSSHEKVLKDPAPVIRLHELGDSSVNFVVRPWSKTGDYWDVYWDITREVKRRFDQEGISIPFPQRDVHIYREDGGGAEGA
jgi:small conductance mechanosensitive channel